MKTSRKNRKSTKDAVERNQRLDVVRLDNISSSVVVVRRRLVNSATLSTNGAGYIGAQNVTSDGARSASDFSSFASRYNQFRVRAIRVRLVPIVDATTAVTVGGGAVTPHPTALIFAQYRGNNAFTSYDANAAGANAKLFNGREKVIEYTADWAMNPDAKLWCDSNAAIPNEQRFGIQFQDPAVAPASSASTAYFRRLFDYDIEFMGPQ